MIVALNRKAEVFF